ncbi:MAG: exodeoxyribonuclease VII large subunit [Synergistaceae bacterium]|jgi:exodeoxyribonuclease VII large subunit|nr:exodeoxyribonuclease VII large subunit [Synergistaceae bacterium]
MNRRSFTPLPQIPAKREALTVDSLSELLREILAGIPELRNVAVKGELQNFKRHSSGHVYFTLVGTESRLSCVLFRSHASGVLDWPEDGDEVIVTGSVEIYPKGGSYQLYATRILPLGLGAQSRAREELRARLEREGLFDARHKRPLPQYPSKVAVVTSPTGAAIQDILKVSASRAPFVDIIVVPATVQGVDAPAQVARALSVCGRLKGISCVILARGGGAKDDLSPFDDERIVRAVRGCPIPVVTGVGHETDSSLADLAADAALPTPSAAAERVFPDSGEIRRRLIHARDLLASGMIGILTHFQNLLDRQDERMNRLVMARIGEDEKFLDGASRELFLRIGGAIERNEHTLRTAAAALDAFSPLAVLGRGYAICRNENGVAVRRADALSLGDKIDVRFQDGGVTAAVLSVRLDAGASDQASYTNLKSKA